MIANSATTNEHVNEKSNLLLQQYTVQYAKDRATIYALRKEIDTLHNVINRVQKVVKIRGFIIYGMLAIYALRTLIDIL